MAYEMVMPYHLHMPSYFLETFTEYPFFFWEIFLHDLILPPGGIKSEFIMREILIGRKSKSKVQVKRIKCSFSSRL